MLGHRFEERLIVFIDQRIYFYLSQFGKQRLEEFQSNISIPEFFSI